MRYIQEDHRDKPKKDKKEEPRVLAGSEDYDYLELATSKKILTGRGEL